MKCISIVLFKKKQLIFPFPFVLTILRLAKQQEKRDVLEDSYYEKAMKPTGFIGIILFVILIFEGYRGLLLWTIKFYSS